MRYQLRHVRMRATGADRTRDLPLTMRTLYQLSFGGTVPREGFEPATERGLGPLPLPLGYQGR
jgi:hypothetical protein